MRRMQDREVLSIELVATEGGEQVVRITSRRKDGRTSVRSLHPAPLECSQHAARRLAAHHGLTPVGALRWEQSEARHAPPHAAALRGELAS